MSLLYDELDTSALFCSLFGTKRTFERQLKLTDIYYIMHNNKKAALTLNTKRDLTKPYAFFNIGSLRIVKDQMNNKAIRRSGITHANNNFAGINAANSATIHNFFMFPTEISCEFHYNNADIKALTKFVEVFLIMAVTDCFNFVVKINEEAHWIARIEVTDDTISIPEFDLDAPDSPSTPEIVVPFIIHTHIGFIRDAAKVNSFQPTITFAMSTNEETTEIVP